MNVSAVLGRFTVADVGAAARSVHTVRAAQSVGDAVQVLLQHHVLGAPVVDDAARFIGFVDLADVVAFAISLVGEGVSVPPVDRDEDAAAAPQVKMLTAKDEEFLRTPVAKILNASGKNSPASVTPTTSLLEVATTLSTKARRVVVLDAGNQIVGIVTQSTILSFLQQHRAELAGVFRRPVGSLLSKDKLVVVVSEDVSAFDAFRAMSRARVGSVALVDSESSIITPLSTSDIKGVFYATTLGSLAAPAISFIAGVRQHSTFDMSPSISVSAASPLETAVAKLAATRVHRLFVTDENRRPVGVISLTDICAAAADE